MAEPAVPLASPVDTNPVVPVVSGLVIGHTQAATQRTMAKQVDFRGDVAPLQHEDGGATHPPDISSPLTRSMNKGLGGFKVGPLMYRRYGGDVGIFPPCIISPPGEGCLYKYEGVVF